MRQISITNKLSPGLSFAALCAVSLGLWYHPLIQTMSKALEDEKYTHILLILPVSAALICQHWQLSLLAARPSVSSARLLLFSVFLAGIARWGNLELGADLRLTISVAGLILWWIASFLVCFGVQAFRPLAFPLSFLFWMVPPPAALLTRVMDVLQHGSAVAAGILFWFAGTPVSRDGIILFLPGLALEVAPECSSIRSSLMLVVTTMLLAQVLLRSPWRKVLVIAMSIPLSLAKNGLRIFTIGMLATRVDPSYLTGRLHHHGGVVFFAAALVGIFILLWILRRGEEPVPESAGLAASPADC